MRAAAAAPARRASTPGLSVVVPTYREAANIAELARCLAAALSGLDWELLLVDDDSGDGSVQIAADLGRWLPVRMVVRSGVPRDLSAAVLDGIRMARHEVVVVMDADLSHPPERIPGLLAALGADADIVLGSRYVQGGRVDEAWSWKRRLNSRAATWLAWPLAACRDPMAGFFAVDRRALPDLDGLRPIGYKIGLELIVRGGLRVREVPILFRDRTRGASKMDWRAQRDTLRHLHRLYLVRFGAAARLACFLGVGASGFAVDLACYLGLQWVGLEHRLARFASFWPAVTWNWRLNRALTFADRPPRPRARQWTRFAATSLAGLAVNVGGYAALTSLVPVFDRYRVLALVCGVAAGSVVNYVAANAFVYRDGAPGADGA